MSELTEDVRAYIEKHLAARRVKTALVEIRSLSKQKLYVRFSDGVQGIYDVTHLLDRKQRREIEEDLTTGRT